MDIFVSVATQRWYRSPDDSPWEFQLNIPGEHVFILDRLLKPMGSLETSNFIRAHVPYIPYHLDKENDVIDERLKKIYAFIHAYTNKEGQEVIEKMPYYRKVELND